MNASILFSSPFVKKSSGVLALISLVSGCASSPALHEVDKKGNEIKSPREVVLSSDANQRFKDFIVAYKACLLERGLTAADIQSDKIQGRFVFTLENKAIMDFKAELEGRSLKDRWNEQVFQLCGDKQIMAFNAKSASLDSSLASVADAKSVSPSMVLEIKFPLQWTETPTANGATNLKMTALSDSH